MASEVVRSLVAKLGFDVDTKGVSVFKKAFASLAITARGVGKKVSTAVSSIGVAFKKQNKAINIFKKSLSTTAAAVSAAAIKTTFSSINLDKLLSTIETTVGEKLFKDFEKSLPSVISKTKGLFSESEISSVYLKLFREFGAAQNDQTLKLLPKVLDLTKAYPSVPMIEVINAAVSAAGGDLAEGLRLGIIDAAKKEEYKIAGIEPSAVIPTKIRNLEAIAENERIQAGIDRFNESLAGAVETTITKTTEFLRKKLGEPILKGLTGIINTKKITGEPILKWLTDIINTKKITGEPRDLFKFEAPESSYLKMIKQPKIKNNQLNQTRQESLLLEKMRNEAQNKEQKVNVNLQSNITIDKNGLVTKEEIKSTIEAAKSNKRILSQSELD
jgi:hypothetical protein